MSQSGLHYLTVLPTSPLTVLGSSWEHLLKKRKNPKNQNPLFFLPHPSVWKFLGQWLNLCLSCDLCQSYDLCHSCGHTRSFQPLCLARDQICLLALQRHHWATAGIPNLPNILHAFIYTSFLKKFLIFWSCCSPPPLLLESYTYKAQAQVEWRTVPSAQAAAVTTKFKLKDTKPPIEAWKGWVQTLHVTFPHFHMHTKVNSPMSHIRK